MLVVKCWHCDRQVCHRPGEIAVCDDCSGRKKAREEEAARWASLTVEEKLNELKAKLDALADFPSPMDRIF